MCLGILCRDARESGVWDRWCKVQTTYCRGAQRAAEVLNSPAWGIMGRTTPEAVVVQLKDLMGSLKVRWGTACGWQINLPRQRAQQERVGWSSCTGYSSMADGEAVAHGC